MGKSIESGADALVVDPQDHVATALKDLKSGDVIRYMIGQTTEELTLIQDIAFGHKAAIRPVQAGEVVRKYGEVIGRATQSIRPGEHVHVHNIEGIRGRGDQAAEGGSHAAD